MSTMHAVPPPQTRPADAPRATTFVTALCWVQGVYYLITGVWPLVSIETFILVTGPKTDHLIAGPDADNWLVKTVGVLVTAVALVFLYAAWTRRAVPETVILALGAAVALGAISGIYAGNGTIPPIYFADAVAEAILILGWLWALARGLREA